MKLFALIFTVASALTTFTEGAPLPASNALSAAGINNGVARMGFHSIPTRTRRHAHASRVSGASAIVSATNVPTGRPLVIAPHANWLAMNNASTMFGWQLVAGSSQAHAAYLCGNLGASSSMWVALGFNYNLIQAPLCEVAQAGTLPNNSYVADQIKTAASNVYLTYFLNAGRPNSTTFWASACQGLLPSMLDTIDLGGDRLHSTFCTTAGIPTLGTSQNITLPFALAGIQNQASWMYAYLLVSSWKLSSDPATYCASLSSNSTSSASIRARINATKMLSADYIAEIWCSLAETETALPSTSEIEGNVTMAITTLFLNQVMASLNPTTTYIQYLRDNLDVTSLDNEGLNGTEILSFITQTANGDRTG